MVSRRRRTTETANLALPGCQHTTDELLRPGGQTTDDVAARADRFLQLARAADDSVVAVTHGRMSGILAVRSVGLPARYGGALGSATGSLSMIKEHRGRPELTLWNFVLRQATG